MYSDIKWCPRHAAVFYIFFNILRNSSDVPQISVSVRIPEITATPFIPVLASFETFERLIPPIATTGIATLLHIFFNISKDIVILGPGYGVAAAFVSSLIRNLLGLGTLLAFPGSMCGALLAGLLYHYIKKLPAAYIGEVFGTAVIGGMLSYPVAAFIMGSKGAALFTFVVPFLISTAGGTLLAVLITVPLKQTGVLDKIKSELNS